MDFNHGTVMDFQSWNSYGFPSQANNQPNGQNVPVIKHHPYSEPIETEFSITKHFQQHEPEYIAEKNKVVDSYMSPHSHYNFKSKKEAESYHTTQNPTLCIQKAKAWGVYGKVVFHPIEQFMDTIPDRVMQSYLSACELGFKEFLVAEPKIEKAHYQIGVSIEDQVIGMVIQKPADPVLIGVLNDVMFEIDYWE